MEGLSRKLVANEAVVAGVLSGTSVDGIDVALVKPTVERTARGPRLVALETLSFATRPFDADLGRRARAAAGAEGGGAPLDPRGVALLSRDLGRAFGAAARAEADARGLALDLVASHGQTIWHHDGVEPSGAATLQLGDGCAVAEAAGCAAVSDFRARDVAAGGEGAPLSALVDDLLLAGEPRPVALLNLGGIANLSWYGARVDGHAGDDGTDDPGGACLAFDTGPANCLLDGLARRLFGADFDADGARAARGRPVEAVLDELARHPFLAAPPPKSTGRGTFDAAFTDRALALCRAAGASDDDALATAARFVARAVARGLALLPERPARLLVAGGGVHHRPLMAFLEAEGGIPTVSSRAAGLDPDAREALVFAALGVRAALGEPSTRPGATGAAPGRVLGKISPPAR